MNYVGIVSAEDLNLVLESIQDELDVLRYQEKEGEER